MKVSKVVIVVVALHVLVIGGIFVFEGCTRAKTQVPDIASNDDQPASATNSLTPPIPADNTTAMNPPTQPTVPTVPVAPTPAPARSYVVKKSDTLAKIARLEKVSVAELSHANSLTKTSVLKIGQKLTIPAKAEAAPTAVAQAAPVDGGVSAPAPTVAASGASYTVKSGDNLWKIAKSQNVSVAALKQANNLTTDALKVNQKLVIPASATAPTAPVTTAMAPQTSSVAPTSYGEWQPGSHIENGQTVHTVDINENLSGIAKKYGITVMDLKKANNLTDATRITVGQKLTIPTTPAAVPTAAAPTTATPAVATPIVSSSN